MDDDGAFPIFEAVLVAILILGAIVFVSLTASPSQEEGSGGISMGRVASDTLAILQVRPPDDDSYQSALAEIVALALEGQTDQAEDYLREVLPRGTNFEMRLDNGVAPLGLLPHGRTATLRAADGDALLMVAPWSNAPEPIDDEYRYVNHGTMLTDASGNVVDLTVCSNLFSPSGSSNGPGMRPWKELWLQWQNQEDSDGGTPNAGTVPAWAPYGWWRAEGTGCGIDWFRVVHPSCTATNHGDAGAPVQPVCLVERPVYGVQLLVWDGV